MVKLTVVGGDLNRVEAAVTVPGSDENRNRPNQCSFQRLGFRGWKAIEARGSWQLIDHL